MQGGHLKRWRKVTAFDLERCLHHITGAKQQAPEQHGRPSHLRESAAQWARVPRAVAAAEDTATASPRRGGTGTAFIFIRVLSGVV